jgi:hypothetical protein
MAQQNGTATQEIMELLMQTGISENLAQCIQTDLPKKSEYKTRLKKAKYVATNN